ncbi:discoidin domain-containing protein [Actinoplanes sp. CA-030573]|uniref:discoidin domain-containing protein n=1 Tax=Actinoplanes sp. CA-030573 TaxID=3239898 RepID=UPI003D90E3C5
MDGTPTDPADVSDQRTAAQRAASERAASLRAVFASSPRPGQSPEVAAGPSTFGGGRRPGDDQPAAARPAARPAAEAKARRRRWPVPVLVLAILAGGAAAAVATGKVHIARPNPAAAEGHAPATPPPGPNPAGSTVPATASAGAEAGPKPTATGRPNLALGKRAKASSLEAAGFPAAAAVDGDLNTRWSSAFADPQWFLVDLGAIRSIRTIRLRWEHAYAVSYRVDISTDLKGWTTVYRTTSGKGGIRDIPLEPTAARYVRMYGTKRNSVYGYSLQELEVR